MTGTVALPMSQVDVSLPDVTGRTINVAAGGDLQAAINSAKPGDQIVLAAGAVFKGSYTLPNKGGDGWITIRSAGPLPAEGSRATASDVSGMATLLAPGANGPALATEAGAHNYRIIGLNITAAPGITEMTSLVNLGDGNATQNTLASQPHDIVIDRSYIHGSDALDLRRGVALNSANSAVINSTISDVHSRDSDAQAIAGWNGTGPYLIANNMLSASGENVMFGGSDPSIPNALPSDITIRGNDFYKPLSWQGVWLTKNLLELKLGQRVLVENNTFKNNWADAQVGFAINIKSTDQNGTAPWSTTSNVTIRNNLIQNSPSGITMAASPDEKVAVPASNIAISGNTFENIGGTSGSPSGTLFQLVGAGGSLRNISITGNTALKGDSNLNSTLVFDGSATQGLTFANNQLMQGQYGIKGNGAAEGAATLAAYAPDAIFTGNVLVGSDPGNYKGLTGSNTVPATTLTGASPVGTGATGTKPALAVSITEVTGATNQATRVVSGTATAASGALVKVMDGSVLLAAATVTAAGTWSTTVTLPAEGSNALVASETSTDGRTGRSSTVSTTLDRTAPELDITTVSGTTTQRTAVLQGTIDVADAGRTISVYRSGVSQAVSTAQASADGRWSATVQLDAGANVFTAGVTDAAGNADSSDAVTLTRNDPVSTTPGTQLTDLGSLSGSASGTWTVATTAVGGYTLRGSSVLSNAGAIVQTSNSAIGDASGSAATLLNLSGSTYTIAGDYSLARGRNANSRFDNAGTLTKSQGSGRSVIAADVTSDSGDGAIIVNAGTLALTGRHTSLVGQAISGAGTFAIAGGRSSIGPGTTIDTAGFTISGQGTVVTLGEALRVNGTVLDTGGTTIDTHGQQVRFAGSATFSTDSTGTPTITGGGQLTASGRTAISGLAIGDTATFRNAGVVTQSGSIRLGDADSSTAGIINDGGTAWMIAGDFDITADGTNNSIANGGAMLEKTAGKGTSVIGAAITNTTQVAGFIEVKSGTLELDGAVTGLEVMQIDEDATLILGTSASGNSRVAFSGPDSTLALTSKDGFAGQIADFVEGNTIDLRAFDAGHASLGYRGSSGGGALTISSGSATTVLHLTGSYSTGDFHLADDGHGGLAVSVI